MLCLACPNLFKGLVLPLGMSEEGLFEEYIVLNLCKLAWDQKKRFMKRWFDLENKKKV